MSLPGNTSPRKPQTLTTVERLNSGPGMSSIGSCSLPETPQPGSMRVAYAANIQVASPGEQAMRSPMSISAPHAARLQSVQEALTSSAQRALSAMGGSGASCSASGMLTPRFSQEVGREQDEEEAELEREIAEAANATEAAHARLRDALAKLQTRRLT